MGEFDFSCGPAKAVIPVGLLDEREARYLPPTATSELTEAITRLTANDESGAITAACGAVDATTDVHGTQPAYKKIAYDTIKWASAICGLFEGE